MINKKKLVSKKITENPKTNKIFEAIDALNNTNAFKGSDFDIDKQLQLINNLTLSMTTFHLNKVKETTGEIELADIVYCQQLEVRIMAYAMKIIE